MEKIGLACSFPFSAEKPYKTRKTKEQIGIYFFIMVLEKTPLSLDLAVASSPIWQDLWHRPLQEAFLSLLIPPL